MNQSVSGLIQSKVMCPHCAPNSCALEANLGWTSAEGMASSSRRSVTPGSDFPVTVAVEAVTAGNRAARTLSTAVATIKDIDSAALIACDVPGGKSGCLCGRA